MAKQPDRYDCDVAVIGSGFGGAVSALRLAEKGYDVLVLEQGRRLRPKDILRARTDLRAHLWDPDIGMHGFFWQRVFRDVGIIGAAGVGGGSIVWGGVLLEPEPGVFEDPAWGDAEEDWRSAMAPHYAEAARMLGRVTNPYTGAMDDHLGEAAKVIGGEENFGPVPLAVHFGEEGRTVPDPFFGGRGPDRTGCVLCGGCLSGCPYGSKNTLDLNYLYLAERLGARIHSERKVTSITPGEGGGYRLDTSHPWRRQEPETVTARKVILAAGVLGTLELLMRSRDESGTLPRVSKRLGDQVRTNSEAVSAVIANDPGADLSRGPAISTDFRPDPGTHITQNRYVGGGKMLRWQVGPLIDGGNPAIRSLRTAGNLIRHPLVALRAVFARNFEQRLTAITVMQEVDSELRFELRRSRLRPWQKVLQSRPVAGHEAPSYLPAANDVARAFAESSGGRPMNLLVESLGGRSVTAHILGGAVIAEGPEGGVIDSRHEVHGHPGIYVMDASAIPVNLGVNPSLTITALAERFTSLWPEARHEETAEGEETKVSERA